MIQDIDRHIEIINKSIEWAGKYRKDSFPVEQFKDYRRKLNKIRRALTDNCSAAAYGESQVGKSYLMSSLLSSSDCPFVIENNGKEYSFIDQLNPSGGNNSKIESTGVITRFTLRKTPLDNSDPVKDMVKVDCLSIVDIILLLADSYYNDIKIQPDSVLKYDAINSELNALSYIWEGKQKVNKFINEDDIRDINDYIKEVIGNNASAIYHSNFARTIAPVIQYIPVDKWVDVFSLLWNKNPEINRLFTTLINAYQKIGFQQEIYVPFDAVLRENGTLLKIEWLDTVCGIPSENNTDRLFTDIYNGEGHKIASDFSKGELSALIAELTFELPEDIAHDRPFLKEMDLLDFPGARSREKYKEREISSVLPKMLRRGKVAYLFNKYSRSLRISSVLFCHHNDQKAEPTIGETVNNWIEENIGEDTRNRAEMLRNTNNISPLFLVATKFNIDLERTKIDNRNTPESLDKHWNRFDTVFPEIIKPDRWLDEWSESASGTVTPFQSIYPLRDFFWSGKNNLFDGYSDGEIKSPEKGVHINPDFPDYLDRLKESFLRNKFVETHFSNPERSWEEFATLNNDGSKAIIRDLNSISGVLDRARRNRYLTQLKKIKKEIIDHLSVFYEPIDADARNKKVRKIAGELRRSLMQTVAADPAAFGRILDRLMIHSEELRNIAYDIIVCHTDTPKDFSALNFIRASAGIDLTLPREENINRLLDYYIFEDEEELKDYLNTQGFDLEDVISKEVLTLSSIGDVITQHLIDYWFNHLHERAQELSAVLPHADEVVMMFIKLFTKLNVRKNISEKVTRYTEIFSENEQPNAIGDFAALTFNDFISNVGRPFLSDNEIEGLKVKAGNCRLPVDFSPTGLVKAKKRQPLMETLRVFDESAAIINKGHIDINTLRQLPFWNNYQRWENFVIIGLIASSDISTCDPESNERVKSLIDNSNPLYNS
ncbi:MAG: putative virulence factor [Muribaculaceae bacterium]|nr:putative virulence factor [Muribaculaceae bacterium]